MEKPQKFPIISKNASNCHLVHFCTDLFNKYLAEDNQFRKFIEVAAFELSWQYTVKWPFILLVLKRLVFAVNSTSKI